MTYQVNPTLWNGVFAIPSAVVDEHLRLCSGLSLKVLLWILRNPGFENDAESLSSALRQSSSDISDALNYWEEHGILQRCGTPPADFKAEAAEAPEPPRAEIMPKAKPVVTRIGRPHFPREEAVSLAEAEPMLASLLDEGQRVLRRAFTSADLDSLVALYSYYGLSAHFILTAMHYCSSLNKRSVGYVESVCVAWLNDGVNDENIGEYVDTLNKRNSNEQLIRREFGIGDRRLSSKERNYISVWFEEYNTPLELISLAYEKAVENTGKLSFSYINTILTSWHKKQIDTVEKATAAEIPMRRGAKAKTSSDVGELSARLAEEFMKE